MTKTEKKPKEVREVAVVQKQEIVSVENFIMEAVKNNLPVETMEKLFALREKVKAAQAKEAFDSAMSKFQGECPVIKKKKDGGKTKSGIVAYKFAPIDYIVSQTKDLIAKNGFSYKTNSETSLEKVKVTIIVKHEFGHSEDTSVEVPLGTKTDIMSAPQVVAAALTFAKRYAFLNAFGIMTGDEDTDAKEDKKEQKPKNVKVHIMNQLKTLGVDISKKEELGNKIFELTKIAPSDNENDLVEISSRLEILISEKNDNK